MSAVLVTYLRSGGRPPSDDESLLVREDGAFEARRTLGGARVGTFAGTLPARTLEALERDATAAREAGELWLETPRDGATESVTLGDDEDPVASLGSNAHQEGAWGTLVERLRELLERATRDPVAALELEADTGAGRLAAIGDAPLEVDTASLEVRLVRLAPSGVPLDRWNRPVPAPPEDGKAPAHAWTEAGPGWSLDLPFDHGFAFEPGDRLQVWVLVDVRTDAVRRARLYADIPAAGGAGEGADS